MVARRELLRSFLATPLVGRFRPWLFAADEDAVPVYRRAFEWLGTLTDSEKDLIRDYQTVPLNADVDRLIERAEPAVSAVRRGARAERCDWGEVVSLDALNRQQLDAGNLKLARIASLRSRRLFADNRGPEALDDLFAVVRLGRRIGNNGLFIAVIFQCAFENIAVTAIARGLPGLDPATRRTIATRLGAEPRTIAWPEFLRREGRFIQATLHKRVEAIAGPIDAESLVSSLFSREEADAVLALTGADRKQLLALIDDVIPKLAELASVLDLNRRRYPPALKDYVARVRPINPIAVSVVDAAEALKYAMDRVAALWAMLAAAVARLDGGEKSFLAIADPYGDGPFKQRPRGNGFDLESALSFEQRPPVILAVGN